MSRPAFKRSLSFLLALAMVLSLCPMTVWAAEKQELLSVQETLFATVAYGTDKETAVAALPSTVEGKVLDTSPLAQVEALAYDFEDEAQLEDWTMLSSLITYENGKLHFANNTNIKAHVGPETLTDFVVQADLQITEETPSSDVGIMLRVTEATNEGPDSYNGYYVGFGKLNNSAEVESGTGIKTGYADTKWHENGLYDYEIDVTKAYTLKAVVFGSTVSTFIKEADADESEFVYICTETTIWESGSVGLRSYKQSFDADNFQVRAVTDQDLADCGIVRTGDVQIPVTEWVCADYDGNTAGQYVFTGELELGEEYDNPQGLTAQATVTVKAPPEQVDHVHSVPFSQVNVEDDFWSAKQKQFICEVVPVAIANISTSTGGMPNFKKASEYLATKEGNYTTTDAPSYGGAIYVDSDVYKVIEAMCYCLQLDAQGDQEIIDGQAVIAAQLEEWIPWFVGSQEADGYLYTSYTLNYTNAMRFTGRTDDMPVHTDGSLYDTVNTELYDSSVNYNNHELYCVGHFYEAAVAHYRATGDFRLLDVAVKNADLVVRTFGYGDDQVQAVPGHQEIELALVKLAALCEEIGVANGIDYGSKAAGYIEKAKFFLDERGKDHDGYGTGTAQVQDNQPVTEMRTAYGHCVRAQYMYTAMADVALLEIANGGENPYDAALTAIWEDVTNTKQYINGGVGVYGAEAFGSSYVLPNDSAYCETCAQVSNVMWNSRMNLLYGDAKYADVLENTLYNSVLSGINFDGDRFFYVNPMQSDNGSLRSAWFGTACCPPNLLRTVSAIGGYIYTQDGDGTVNVNQYIGNTADLNVAGQLVNVSMTTNMPWSGETTFTVNQGGEEAFTVRFRVPQWAVYGNTITVNGEAVSAEPADNGYVEITRVWAAGDKVELNFPMEPVKVYSDEKVTANNGLVAVRRGPMIYVAESVDNPGVDIPNVILSDDTTFTVGELAQLPGRAEEDHYGVEQVVPLTVRSTYQTAFGESTDVELTMIPYFAWGNRGTTVMRVYLNEGASYEGMTLEALATPTASYTSTYGDSVDHMNDGIMVPGTTSADRNRWTAYGSPTVHNWVEYAYTGGCVTLKGVWVTWYDDGGGVQVPDALRVEYWDGAQWVEVTGLTNTDQFPKNTEQYYGFDEITTSRIRLWPTNANATSTKAQPGIVEWRLDGQVAPGVKHNETVRYEAENAVFTSPALLSKKANASGGAAVGSIDNENATVTFTVTAETAGTYSMVLTYSGSTAYPNTAHKYYVNGDTANAQIVTYDRKAGWNDLFNKAVLIHLDQGENTITVTHAGTENSFAQLDCIDLTLVEADPELVNLARTRNASVAVSLVPGDANMLNDGIISSREGNDLDAGPRNRWNTYPTGGTQWAAIELTQKRDICRVDWYALEDSAGTPAANVAVEYWTGYEWLELDVEPVKTQAEGEYCDSKYTTAYLYRFELAEPVNTNKIRVRIDQVSDGKKGAGGTELEVWGYETGLTNLAAVSSTELVASHAGSASDPLSELNDGIISAREGGEKYGEPRNRWNTWPNGGEQWVGAQFEWEQKVNQVLWYALEDGAGTPAVSDLKLQSWNGTEWEDTGITPVKTRWEGPYNDAADPVTCATAYLYTFDFAEPLTTSGLRLVMTQRSDGKYGVGGTELEIWGQYQIQYGFDLEPGQILDDVLNAVLFTNAGTEDRTLYVKLTDAKGSVVETTLSVAAGSEEQAAQLDLTGLTAGAVEITASWNPDYTESKTYSITKPISDSVIQEIYDEIKTPYEYDVIVKPSGVTGDFDASLVDNPNVFRIPGDNEYVYMTYVGHDGVGYRTGLARSKDLVTWEKVGVILDNGEDGNWDSYNAAGYIVRDHVWGQIPTPHVTSEGLYAMTYLASDQPGYEAGIKRAGVAFTDAIFDEDGTPAEWDRHEDPVLDAQGGEYAYEKGIIWKLQAIYNPDDSLYYGFYNAATGPEVMCGAISEDLLSWTRMETNPLLTRDTDPSGGTWGSSHNADADVFKVGDYWVMVYFTSTPGKGIIDSFAVSTDLQNWQKSYTYLTERNSSWSSTYAHKPCMVKVNGVVYHYYCAVGNQGRVIAVDTSIDLTAIKTAQALLNTGLTESQSKILTDAIEALQYELRKDGGSLEEVEAALAQLKYVMENLDSISAADLVEERIDAIGEVTLDSKEAIDTARAAYDALTEEEKALVENYQTLLDAEAAYASLVRVEEVEKLIDAIGEVTLDSKEAIDAARAAYDALTEEEKAQVGNYQTLLDAEERYAYLLLEQKANQVEALIDAIGEVTLDSKEAIDAARAAYDALTDEEKALVENLQKLMDAEHRYAILVAEDYAAKAKAAAEAAEKAYQDALAALKEAEEQIAEDKTAVEEARQRAENAKKAAEDAKAKAEAAESAAEAARKAAEDASTEAAAEAVKAAEEAAKAAAEAQKAAEYAAAAAEAAAETQKAQAAAEAAQAAAEAAQKAAEEAAREAEEAQKRAEENQEAAEKAAEEAQKAKEAAELALKKFEALNLILVYTSGLNTDNLTQHQLEVYSAAVEAAIEAVENAETLEEIEAALATLTVAMNSLLTVCPAAWFTDVDAEAWYHDSIDFVVANGYMNGVSLTTFDPNGTTTRAMLTTLLYRMAGEPDVAGLENPFTDVEPDRYYTNAVIWAADQGIVTGRDKDTFDPNAAVTRQEMVTMLWRYAGYPESEADLSGYTDAGSVKDFAKAAMAWAVETGVLTGMTDTTLAPEGTATRAQIATVLMRYLNN